MTDNLDGPGSASYSPAQTTADGVIFPRTRSMHKMSAADIPGFSGTPVVGNLMPPDPSMGGEMGQPNQLGWSTGFGAFKRLTPLSGRVITRPTMGANPPVGPVGRSDRTTRLRARLDALYTDYTPASQTVAREILDGGLLS